MYRKFGRRPIMLLSLICYCAGLIGASQATSYSGLMAARIIHAFGSGVCEALPVQLVNDIFFLHERGQRIGYYTGRLSPRYRNRPISSSGASSDSETDHFPPSVALCLGSTGPLYAGYMLNGGYSWRLFFYVEFAFACGLLIFAFFVVEETTYNRNPSCVVGTNIRDASPDEAEKPSLSLASTRLQPDPAVLKRKTFTQQLKFWGVYDRDSDFFLMMARSFTYFLVPHVFWVVATYGKFVKKAYCNGYQTFYELLTFSRADDDASWANGSLGIYIGLGALTFNYITPLKVTAPPYNWSKLNSGLIALSTIIGYGAAMPFTKSSDRLAARLTKKNNMIREAEMRLGVCLPAMLISPAGLIVFGLTAQKNLHWFGYFAGVAMTQWGSYFYFTFVLSYALDSYTTNTSEMLIAMNLGKQAISFGMGIDIIEWVEENGYAAMIAGVFCGVLLANNLALIPFMLYGKRIRAFMARTWLAKVHKSSVKEVMAA